MPDTFVQFPGISGSYIWSDDVNLFDADTAHIEQSIGLWGPAAGASAVTQSSAFPSSFGSFVVEAVSNETDIFMVNQPAESFTIDPSTEYTASLDAAMSVNARQVRISVQQYDAGGVSLGFKNGAFIEVNSGSFTRASLTFTTDPATASVRFLVYGQTNAGNPLPVGTRLYFDAACLRRGVDTKFVPSLRIVGDVDMEAKVAPVAWREKTQHFVGQFGSSINRRAYTVFLTNTTTRSRRYVGGVIQTYSYTGAVPIDGVAAVVRSTIEAATGIGIIYIDGVNVFSATRDIGATDVVSVEHPLEVGSGGSNTPGSFNNFNGDIYYAEVRDGIDGPVVARFDAEDIPIS